MAVLTAPVRALLAPERVLIGLDEPAREGVIERLVTVCADHPAVLDLETVREAVLARERRMSTGVGNGVALPHAKTDAVREPVAALAVSSVPVDFETLDGLPVRLIYLLLSPDDTPARHVKLLGRISRAFNTATIRSQLLQAGSVDAALAAFE
ncbi:MAG: PTS sugar transporter subunit IIA [Bacteroidota bacterium]